MGRVGNYPRTIEQYKRISISYFKKNGILDKNVCNATGIIQYTRNNEPSGSVGYEFNRTNKELCTIRFYYTLTNKYLEEKRDISFTVQLIKLKSNLNNSYRYYFKCPKTGLKCIYLYESNSHEYFLHRNCTNAYYESQIRSKNCRRFDKLYSDIFRFDNNEFGNRYDKYRKTHYAGKPTKWYLKYLSKRDKYDTFIANGGLRQII